MITDVAMKSTGVYWKSIFNILGDSIELVLVNARHLRMSREENGPDRQSVDL